MLVNYDSRNNVFSPSNGFYIQLIGQYSDEWFGGDALYGRINVDAIGYFLKLQRNYASGFDMAAILLSVMCLFMQGQ